MHYRGITKECLSSRGVSSNDEGYHALHTIVHGQRFIHGWSSVHADLYDVTDPMDLMETYRMNDPLMNLVPKQPASWS